MKRKVLFLESRYDSFYGAQKSMIKLIQCLDKNEFESVVVTTKEGKLSAGLREENIQVDIVNLGKKANVFGGKVLKYSLINKVVMAFQLLIYNFKMIYYINRNNIDTVYVNDLRALIYSIIATKILRKKNIWYIRADISNSIITEVGLRFSNHIITIANGVLRHLPEKKIELYRHKITNIYTGFDFSKYKIFDKETSKIELGLSKNGIVIGYLGSINERKGTDFLIDSFIEVNKIHNNTELLIVGDVSPGYEKYWGNLLNKNAENRDLIKYVPYSNEVSRVYSAIDIFILPSRSEGLPRVLIEAMGHKIPVIATDVGGTSEIIENNINGLIIEKDNEKDFVNSVNKIIIDCIKRKEIGVLGEKSVKENFSEEKFILNINSYFLKVHSCE